MVWKDPDDIQKINDESEDDYYDEDDYPAWQKGTMSTIGEKLFKRVEMPFIVLGVGLIVLIVMFVVSISGRERTGENRQMSIFEKRLFQLEERLYKIEGLDDSTEQTNETLELFQDKIEKMETSIAVRMNQLASEVNNLQKKTSGVNLSKPTKISSDKKFKKRYHQVRSGENLFSIGRQYGVTVNELRRLNNLSPGATIYAGRKLVVAQTKIR